MTKKDFIALADCLRTYGEHVSSQNDFEALLSQMADFCQHQNPRFNRARWLNYIADECGPNGGRK